MKIIAHRGASSLCPENTLAAYKKALELGADGIELDVYRLYDGTLVVRHDATLGRCEGVTGSLMQFNKETVKGFSVGSFFSKEFKDEKIPYFSEVLDLLHDSGIYLNVEIKSPDGFITDVAKDTCAMLEKYGMRDSCIISSFNHYILREIKENHKGFRTGILFGAPKPPIDLVAYITENGFDAIHPHFSLLDEETVRRCKNLGIEINAWTCDSEAEMKQMSKMDVDGLITNRPQDAIRLFSH